VNRRFVLAAVTVAFVVGAACTDRQVHAWAAWTYDPVNACLDSPAVVDVLSGPDNGPCKEVRCWESQGHDIYITNTACDAPSDFTNETSQKSGLCAAALNLFGSANHGECAKPDAGAGGGVVSTETPE
jgi:hypothetical protein